MGDIRIYRPDGPAGPIVAMGENLGIFVDSAWRYAVAELVEPLPYGSTMLQDFGAIASGASIARALATPVRASEFELIQFRVKPIDNIELIIYMPQGAPTRTSNYVQARVSRSTGRQDPWWASTECFNIGTNRDANIETRNITGYNLGQARAAFWGNRYRIRWLQAEPAFYTRILGEAAKSGRAA